MDINVRNRWNDAILCAGEFDSLRSAIEDHVRNQRSLRGADLCDAKLTRANLTGAILAGADLTDADLGVHPRARE